jgi:hypothetical protein
MSNLHPHENLTAKHSMHNDQEIRRGKEKPTPWYLAKGKEKELELQGVQYAHWWHEQQKISNLCTRK